MFLNGRDAAEASQSLHLPLLIIPIIMAHCENLINNTEDIVVAISHMVVGLCSVTTLPLASTYVCQKHAAMTSCTSAHLALPLPPVRPPTNPAEEEDEEEEAEEEGGRLLLASCQSAFLERHI